ncbi:MAG: preprotein translocase subunit SecA [Candidatus Omnitrophica bacterium]|nr:preprotein translocase subunit SecA [Candidatus Omnitrophota bacterium]MDD5311009.1 preprotein translocase subunit SecA [Candidatus Omnitrophota bacterium]MDD5546567.1 preprotein translocase subunit SecA [Candidatus Omnitrophota bacterium]
MIGKILSAVVGTHNDRELKRLKPKMELITSLEPRISKLSDAELRAKTADFKAKIKERLKDIDLKGLEKAERRKTETEVLEEVLPEAFAVVRETSKRVTGMRHFDVQLVGGIVLHEGKIAEMATGEGKTLVATLPAYLNALTGLGVHIVTVNDYLAKRDRYWMGPIFEFLGLTVGMIQHDMNDRDRQAAYNSDITYGTNNEFGFDYLRDNMKYRLEDMVQRPLHYGIVDEVDSILVDEARTPLIISGPAEESTDKYYKAANIVRGLEKGEKDQETKEESGDYIVDEKGHSVWMTEQGETKVVKAWGLKDMHSMESVEERHCVEKALLAKELYKRDVQYLIKDGEVIIVDEFTGRMMPGRRWSDGLHQAVEAKEGVKIERENQTLATITFQNYFRMFDKLAGMTGTAATEANEFSQIYKLDVVVIPTNRPLIRTNHPDSIYKSEKEKFNAAADEIAQLYEKGQPVLVGTISIDKSERLSNMLQRRGIPHQVLNAKYHESEAHIVAQAGRYKAITIATNMAGRGTDILLGGNAEYMVYDYFKQKGIEPEAIDPKEKAEMMAKFKSKVEDEHNKVIAVGGLHVLGTERHEARRIDNQLRGRCGRQGDPGSSRFYLSLEDDLMRIFGSDRIKYIMEKLGMEEGQPIEHPIVSKSIETAQKRVEAHNFEIRKQLLEYDNVMNKQREVIYSERRAILEGKDIKEYIAAMIENGLDSAMDIYLNEKTHPEEWDAKGFFEWFRGKFGFGLPADQGGLFAGPRHDIRARLLDIINKFYEKREFVLGADVARHIEKTILLDMIDSKWKDHLYTMDLLKEGIGLRAYGQVDPLVEYKNEGFAMFEEMMNRIQDDALEFIFKVQVATQEKPRGVFESVPQQMIHREMGSLASRIPQSQGGEPVEARPPDAKQAPLEREAPKVGRNDPCPCGSGKKYKKCCGA